MNIVLYGRPQASFVEEDLNALFAALDSNGLSYRINRDFARLITEKPEGRLAKISSTMTV